VCEDGDGEQFVVGVGTDGRAVPGREEPVERERVRRHVVFARWPLHVRQHPVARDDGRHRRARR